MNWLYDFFNLFSAIRPGMICAILQSAAQYLWYTIEVNEDQDQYDQCDDKTDICKNGWHLRFSPFWYEEFISNESM